MKDHNCPICQKELESVPRYPNYLCSDCVKKAKDKDGRALGFSNIGMSGGFQAHYKDSDEEYKSHQCFVEGVECYANEAKFGGVVLEKIVDNIV